MIRKICRQAGCNKLAEEGHNYCQKHLYREQEIAERSKHRFDNAESSTLYNSAQWRTMAKRFLSENPICARCGKPASVVDHIIPHRGNIELFYQWENLQPLCKDCHDKKTAEEIRERRVQRNRGQQRLWY